MGFARGLIRRSLIMLSAPADGLRISARIIVKQRLKKIEFWKNSADLRRKRHTPKVGA